MTDADPFLYRIGFGAEFGRLWLKGHLGVAESAHAQVGVMRFGLFYGSLRILQLR
ncbi:MAG TPA: hypothetical protein VME47_24180 [Acetobacteraceae bacterium]|nr:hypothetical protein [Acetobacteraceae bacterium]